MIEKSSNDLNFQKQSKVKPSFIYAAIITILLISIYRLGVQITVPLLNEDAFEKYFGIYKYFDSYAASRFSIFALGLMPYISAYVLVEIFSLILPFLKKLRKGDSNGRQKLKRIALLLTLVLGILQGADVINSLKKMELPNGIKILNIVSGYEYVLLICILVGSVYILILICELISKFGIGHGISLILLSGICADFYRNFSKQLSISNEIGSKVYIISLCGFFLLVCLTVILLKTKVSVKTIHEKDNKSCSFFQLNFCPSAKVAIIYASSLIMIPATISNFFSNGNDFANTFRPGSFFYEVSMVISVFFFSYLFAWLFFHPRIRFDRMRSRGWKFMNNELSSENHLLQKLFIYNLPWTVFLCFLATSPYILITKFNVPFYIGGASTLLIVAISLDVFDLFNFINGNIEKPIKIAEFHDVYDAAMIKNHLNAEGILCHMQGYYHRHLLYFFGPYIEISLMVSYEDQGYVKELIHNYYGGIGLSLKT